MKSLVLLILKLNETKLVMENPKIGKKSQKINHIKMQIMPDFKADTVSGIVKEQIESTAELSTDDSKTSLYVKSYCNVSQGTNYSTKVFRGKMFDRLVFAATKYNTDIKPSTYNRSLCG